MTDTLRLHLKIHFRWGSYFWSSFDENLGEDTKRKEVSYTVKSLLQINLKIELSIKNSQLKRGFWENKNSKWKIQIAKLLKEQI